MKDAWGPVQGQTSGKHADMWSEKRDARAETNRLDVDRAHDLGK